MKGSSKMKTALIALASAAVVAACGYVASDITRPSASQIEAAKEVTADAGKELAVGLCPIGAAYLNDVGASGGPLVAAMVRAATATACANLTANLDKPVPASSVTGAPVYCALEPVNAGEQIALADGSAHTITPEEAAAFNAGLAARCGA